MVLLSIFSGAFLGLNGLVAAVQASTDASTPPYKNPHLPIAQRVSDLLGRMTIEDKMAQLMQGTHHTLSNHKHSYEIYKG